MIRCLALDDEPLALQQLTSYLEQVPFFEMVGSCLTVSEAMRLLHDERVDVLFLDINMPDLNGLELVHSLTNPPLVVFTTAYSEYAIEGYKADAVDYLLKPYGLSDLLRAANHVRERWEQLHSSSLESVAAVQPPSVDDFIFFKSDYKVVRVCISEIVYVKGMSEYLRIYTTSHPKPIIVLLSMKRIEDRLSPPLPFMRVHRSYLINLNHIRELNRSSIVLDTGAEIPVGDTYRAAVNEFISRLSVGK